MYQELIMVLKFVMEITKQDPINSMMDFVLLNAIIIYVSFPKLYHAKGIQYIWTKDKKYFIISLLNIILTIFFSILFVYYNFSVLSHRIYLLMYCTQVILQGFTIFAHDIE